MLAHLACILVVELQQQRPEAVAFVDGLCKPAPNERQLEVEVVDVARLQVVHQRGHRELLVVVDDLSLPFGALRMKPSGSDGGHNGLKHIASVLGTQAYARLRFGIGNDFPRGGQIDYVLGHFSEEDLKTMDERVELACEMIKSFCLAGIQITMNQYNKK